MAHLIRPWQVRYIDKDGKRCASTEPGAKKVKGRARKWYGAGIPGIDKRVPLASDKNIARTMLAELVKKAERGEAGLEDKATEAGKTPLATHLEDFRSSQRAASEGITEKQVAQNQSRLRAVFDACGFVYPEDIDGDAVASYLADRRRLAKAEGGLSIQTSNFYLKTVKQFCRWMVERDRMRKNPLAKHRGGNPKNDRRHDRRDLKPNELVKLLEAARMSAKAFRGLTGPERHLLYLTACGTGFRRGELASMTPQSFDLDADPPTATVSRAYIKNRKTAHKTARQPLPAAVAEALRPFLIGKPAGVPVWPGQWWTKGAEMLRVDLEAAGIPYETKGPDGPLFADFHALRHSYISLMERAGVSLNDAKELARHSTIVLTKDRYTHADGEGLGKAVNKLDLPGADAKAAKAPDAVQMATAVILLQTVLGVLLSPVAPKKVQPKVKKRRQA
jgi:integrase/recombinase XerD